MATDHIVQLKLRLDRALHARLTVAAEKGGRSLNATIVAHLNRSLESQDAEAGTDVGDDPETRSIAKLLAAVMAHAGHAALALSDSGMRWTADRFAYDRAMQAAVVVLDTLRPADTPERTEAIERIAEARSGLAPEHAREYVQELGSVTASFIMAKLHSTEGTEQDARLRRAVAPLRHHPRAGLEQEPQR